MFLFPLWFIWILPILTLPIPNSGLTEIEFQNQVIQVTHLASGKYGHVFKTNETSPKSVIKVIPPITDIHVIPLDIENEINILHFLDMLLGVQFQTETSPDILIKMKYIEGQTIVALLKDHVFKISDDLGPLAEALKQEINRLHSFDISHGDIHFKNILFTVDRYMPFQNPIEAHLIDYGFAQNMRTLNDCMRDCSVRLNEISCLQSKLLLKKSDYERFNELIRAISLFHDPESLVYDIEKIDAEFFNLQMERIGLVDNFSMAKL